MPFLGFCSKTKEYLSFFCLAALVIHPHPLTSPDLLLILYFGNVSSGLQVPCCHFYLLKSFASFGGFAQMPFPPWGLLQCPQWEIIILSFFLQWYIIHFFLKYELAYAFHYSFVFIFFPTLNVYSWKARPTLTLSLPPLVGSAQYFLYAIHFIFVMLNWTVKSIFQLWRLHHPRRLTKLTELKIHSTPLYLNTPWVGFCFFFKSLLCVHFCPIVA